MTTLTKQRMESDMATIDKREIADKTLSDNRNRNDLLTEERRFEEDRGEMASNTLTDIRNKNDHLTQDRRFKADKTMGENRIRNDEMTFNRRETKDGNWVILPIVNYN